jgi:hypothetical protein
VQLNEAALICIYVLYHVKKWVDGCGGNTEIALIPLVGGRVALMPSTEVDKFEKYSEAYDDALKNLLLAGPRTPNNKALFDQYIESAKIDLMAARTMFQEWEVMFREVAGHLGMNYEQMLRDSEEAAEAMFSTRYSAPTNVYEEGGAWVFDHFPNGQRTRFGTYQDKDIAMREWEKVTAEWKSRDGLTLSGSQTSEDQQ